jgi:hypothetical protein
MMPGADIEAGVAAFERHWRDGRRIHFADSGHFIPFDRVRAVRRGAEGLSGGALAQRL